MGHLFTITSSAPHFFNKTDFEQYLLKVQIQTQPLLQQLLRDKGWANKALN